MAAAPRSKRRATATVVVIVVSLVSMKLQLSYVRLFGRFAGLWAGLRLIVGCFRAFCSSSASPGAQVPGIPPLS
eukprot:1343561-Amorphochlora_amoeboformis.AAC.1